MLYSPEHGGSYEVFNERPMRPALVKYCAQDVQCLPRLAEVYGRKLTAAWAARVASETVRRLAESRAADYRPNGDHKRYGPSGWY